MFNLSLPDLRVGLAPEMREKWYSPAPEDSLNRKRSEPERRKWTRLPLAIPVFVHSGDENSHQFLELASALNVSAGGMLIALRRSLAPTARVQLEIPISPAARLHANPSRMEARAKRVKQSGEYYLVAFEFLVPLLPTATRT